MTRSNKGSMPSTAGENGIESLALAFTVAWLGAWLVYAVICLDEVRPHRLNEWGDFFAGVTGPVAFFWLVLGYKQNSRAVAAATQQLHESVRQHEERQAAEVRATQPAFTISGVDSEHDHEYFHMYYLTIKNSGDRCTDLVCYFEIPQPTTHNTIDTVAALQTGEAVDRVFFKQLRSVQASAIRVCYVDKAGVLRAQRFRFSITTHSGGRTTLWFRKLGAGLAPVPPFYEALVDGKPVSYPIDPTWIEVEDTSLPIAPGFA